MLLLSYKLLTPDIFMSKLNSLENSFLVIWISPSVVVTVPESLLLFGASFTDSISFIL